MRPRARYDGLLIAVCALMCLAWAPHARAEEPPEQPAPRDEGAEAQDAPAPKGGDADAGPGETYFEIAGRQVPRSLIKHVVFHTTLGDLRFALRPELAPEQCRRFLAYCRAGVYEGRIINRVERNRKLEMGFLDRRMLREEKGVERLPGELDRLFEPLDEKSSDEQVTRGALYFAAPQRDNAFLGMWLGGPTQAPKGMGPFANLFTGHDTVERLEKVRVTESKYPRAPLRILTVDVLDPDDVLKRDPTFEQLVEERYRAMAEPEFLKQRGVREARRAAPVVAPVAGQDAVAMLGAVLALLGLAVFGLQRRLTPRTMQALGMVALLVGGLAVYVRLEPMAPGRSWLAASLFFGALAAYLLTLRMDAPPPRETPAELFGAGPASPPGDEAAGGE